MDLDEAIQSFEDEMEKQTALGHSEHIDNLEQMSEWLKELKEYKEQRGERMNEAEKERLIKKDIVSIENRVRHAFNQGYEMGMKDSRSEIPNTCGDAISRQAVLNAMYELCDTGETLKENPWRDNPHIDGVVEAIEELPPVSPQQRTGRWERMSDLPNDVDDRFECSRCGNIVHHRSVMDLRTFSRWCGRCGSYNG